MKGAFVYLQTPLFCSMDLDLFCSVLIEDDISSQILHRICLQDSAVHSIDRTVVVYQIFIQLLLITFIHIKLDAVLNQRSYISRPSLPAVIA